MHNEFSAPWSRTFIHEKVRLKMLRHGYSAICGVLLNALSHRFAAKSGMAVAELAIAVSMPLGLLL